MKGTRVLFIGAIAALVLVMTVPWVSQETYAAEAVVHIERLRPAESQEVESGGGEIPSVLLSPIVRGNDTTRIEQLVPAETAESEMGGGETPSALLPPFERGHDTGRIERLLPAETAE